MITLLQGSPGHGKSYTLVKEIAVTVRKNEPFATNVPLRPDWPEVMASYYTFLPKLRKKAVAAKADKYRVLGFVSDDIDELLRVRLAGKGEGRGKLIIDESHRDMNARVERTTSNRRKIIGYVSAHRHYGFDVLLATQDEKNIDTQIRGLHEFLSTVRNFKKAPWIGALIWFNLFLRVTVWNDRAKTKAHVQVYGLSKKLANLYDTHYYAEKDWPADAIILPVGAPCDRPHIYPEREPGPEIYLIGGEDLSGECPKCEAQPGERCITPSGNPATKRHREREAV